MIVLVFRPHRGFSLNIPLTIIMIFLFVLVVCIGVGVRGFPMDSCLIISMCNVSNNSGTVTLHENRMDIKFHKQAV